MKRILCVILLCAWVSAGYGDVREDYRESLKGIEGVGVVVECLRPEAKEGGLTEQQLQTDVELRLRKAGVRVISFEETPLRAPGSPFLYVAVNIRPKAVTYLKEAIPHRSKQLPIYPYGLDVEFRQAVTVVRDPSITVSTATTWISGRIFGGVSIVTADLMRLQIRDHVAAEVDEFINDYLAVNPIKPAQEGKTP